MYASLTQVDLVLSGKHPDQRHFLQTDHRTGAEIEENLELSILFAIIRTLNPLRLRAEGEPAPIVSYLLNGGQCPEAFRQVVAATGAIIVEDLEHMDELVANAETSNTANQDALIKTINENMAALALKVCRRDNLVLSVDGLTAYEKTREKPDEDNTIAYWSYVIELGAVTGALISQSNGGIWLPATSGSLPLGLVTRYQGEEAMVNPLGKVIKFLQYGDKERPSHLLQSLQAH